MAVGISYTEYYLNSAPYGMSAYTATSGTLSVVCGRLSFALSLKVSSSGPDSLLDGQACYLMSAVSDKANKCLKASKPARASACAGAQREH